MKKGEKMENKRKVIDGEKGERRKGMKKKGGGGRELNREMQTQRNTVQYMRLIF